MSWKKPKTKKEYFKLAMEVWKDIAVCGHTYKSESKLYPLIEYIQLECPLCEKYYEGCGNNKTICNPECPLKNCNFGSLFYKWEHAETKSDTIIYASKIYFKIKKAYDKLYPQVNE